MTERSVTHATFVLERTYKAEPAKVFAHWADPALKRTWWGAPGEERPQLECDFRVGGYERGSGTAPGGTSIYTYEARFDDIVADERIVYVYTMGIDGVCISSSLGTVVLEPLAGGGTRLTYTEQGAFLDGLDTPPSREHGTAELLDQLREVVDA